MNKLPVAAVLSAMCIGLAHAGECPEYVNQRMYGALQQLTAAQGSADRKRLCAAVRRAVSEGRTAVSVGCSDYSQMIRRYEGLAASECEPYGL